MKTLLIKKILLPVDFPATSVSVFQQAVTLAERFQAELVMLDVATPESHAAGVPADDRTLANWNLLAGILQMAGPRSQEAASWAAQLAAEFGAHLTLSHVTESMAILAPGGTWANPEWQQALVDDASRRLTELKTNLRVKVDLLVGSGDVPRVLKQIAKKTKADLLVLDCYPYSGNLRTHGYAIICTVSIPVLSV